MKLNDFLTTEGISMARFAQSVETTTATISRIADSAVVPRRDLMHRIYVATNGLVTPNDLLGFYCVHPCNFAAGTGATKATDKGTR